MAYTIYITNIEQELQALTLALLRIKEDKSALEPGEAEILARIRGRTEETSISESRRRRTRSVSSPNGDKSSEDASFIS
jgi:hypothetical protein